jgi:hypothetical protein
MPSAAKVPRKGRAITAWLPGRTKDVLEELAQKGDRTITGELMRALRRHFEAEGVEWTREMEQDGADE